MCVSINQYNAQKKKKTELASNRVPSIKVSRLNTRALTSSASQGTSTITVDTARHFLLSSTKLYRHVPTSHTQPALLCSIIKNT